MWCPEKKKSLWDKKKKIRTLEKEIIDRLEEIEIDECEAYDIYKYHKYSKCDAIDDEHEVVWYEDKFFVVEKWRTEIDVVGIRFFMGDSLLILLKYLEKKIQLKGLSSVIHSSIHLLENEYQKLTKAKAEYRECLRKKLLAILELLQRKESVIKTTLDKILLERVIDNMDEIVSDICFS